MILARSPHNLSDSCTRRAVCTSSTAKPRDGKPTRTTSRQGGLNTLRCRTERRTDRRGRSSRSTIEVRPGSVRHQKRHEQATDHPSLERQPPRPHRHEAPIKRLKRHFLAYRSPQSHRMFSDPCEDGENGARMRLPAPRRPERLPCKFGTLDWIEAWPPTDASLALLLSKANTCGCTITLTPAPPCFRRMARGRTVCSELFSRNRPVAGSIFQELGRAGRAYRTRRAPATVDPDGSGCGPGVSHTDPYLLQAAASRG